MAVVITFIDSSVLIAAARGNSDVSERAFDILNDPDRIFASSDFVRLEVLPKAIYNGKTDEAEFYEEFFRSVQYWAQTNNTIIEKAFLHAKINGLSAIDALHIAAAEELGAEELVTTEKPSKPICRTVAIQVRSIQQ